MFIESMSLLHNNSKCIDLRILDGKISMNSMNLERFHITRKGSLLPGDPDVDSLHVPQPLGDTHVLLDINMRSPRVEKLQDWGR